VAYDEPRARDSTFGEELVERAAALPSASAESAFRVADLCGDPLATPREIAEALSEDEALASLVLHTANSAAVNWGPSIADLPTAVVRLGLRFVGATALAAPGLGLLDGPADDLWPARESLHRHAVCTGLVAQALAPAGIDADLALTAGLLHNIGLNLIAGFAPAEFGYLLECGEQFWEAEDWIFGFSHSDLGAKLAAHWSYPADLVIAISDHDIPDPRTPLARLVRLADLLVRDCGIGVEPRQALPPSEEACGIDLEHALEIVHTVLLPYERPKTA
jgi:HD-like signal output (HDOD) protein